MAWLVNDWLDAIRAHVFGDRPDQEVVDEDGEAVVYLYRSEIDCAIAEDGSTHYTAYEVTEKSFGGNTTIERNPVGEGSGLTEMQAVQDLGKKLGIEEPVPVAGPQDAVTRLLAARTPEDVQTILAELGVGS